jgi:large subunit ribosomal protein L13
MDEVFIDASGQVVGRLASGIARELLRGRNVYVINAEKSVISGDPKYIIKTYKEKVDRGDPYHGPFYPRSSDAIIKRTVRGMLPKKARGTEAFRRLRVFKSKPGVLEGRKFESPESSRIKQGQSKITLGKLSERLGAKR